MTSMSAALYRGEDNSGQAASFLDSLRSVTARLEAGLLAGPILAGLVFTYMTSSSRLLVPFLFNSCSSVMNINGRVQVGQGRPRLSRGRVRASCRWMRNRRTRLSVTAVRASALLP
jgi:hypothetical protein